MGAETTTPQTHPIAVRLQAWVDRFDKVVRKVVRERTGQVLIAPAPKVRLIVDPTVNAFIMGMPMCIAKAPRPAAANYPMLVFTKPSEASIMDDFCLEPKSWPTTPSPVTWLNGLHGYPVRETEDAILIGDPLSPAPLHATRVASVSNLSLVNVNIGLVTEMSEKSAAVVIAHELGHYYRAHSSTASQPHYDFWYDRDRHVPERPTPVANQSEYVTQYEQLKVSRFLVPGQLQHARLGATLVAWAREMKTTPGHACEAVQKTVAKWPGAVQAELTLDSSTRELSGAARRAYLDLEKQLAPCIENVKLIDGATTTDAWAANEVPRQWFTDRLRSPMSGAIPSTDLATMPTLKALVEKLTAKAKELDAAGPAFLKHLEQNQIGLYTIEQEADDISMELAMRLGLTTNDVYQSYTELMRWVERYATTEKFEDSNNSMSAAECEALLASGFKQNGADVHVPLGTLEDPHHALCYRLFNLFRENEAHRYVPGAPDLPQASPPWADLQKQGLELLSPPPKPTKPGGTTKPPTGDPTPETGEGEEPPVSEEAPPAPPGPTITRTTSGCSAAPGSASSGLTAFVLGLAALLCARRRR